MSARVQKLERLLARVRQRRDLPRPVRAVVAPQAAPEEEPKTGVHPSVSPEVRASEAGGVPSPAPAAASSNGKAAAPSERSFAGVASSAPPAQPDEPAASASPLADAMEKFASSPPAADEAAVLQAPAHGPPADDEKLRPITLPDAEAPAAPSTADRRIAHQPPAASGPVAQSLGQAPEQAEPTFEQLIARSLALRPRG